MREKVKSRIPAVETNYVKRKTKHTLVHSNVIGDIRTELILQSVLDEIAGCKFRLGHCLRAWKLGCFAVVFCLADQIVFSKTLTSVLRVRVTFFL
jgi:hypothetical protein